MRDGAYEVRGSIKNIHLLLMVVPLLDPLMLAPAWILQGRRVVQACGATYSPGASMLSMQYGGKNSHLEEHEPGGSVSYIINPELLTQGRSTCIDYFNGINAPSRFLPVFSSCSLVYLTCHSLICSTGMREAK